MELRRRDVLKLGLLGSAALYLPSERYARALSDDRLTRLPTPFTRAYAPPPLIDLRASANGGQAQTALELEMRQISVPVLGPGFPTTPLWAYVKGYGTPAPMVDPTIKVDQGIPLALTQINRLPKRHPQLGYESLTSVHLHGSPSLPQFDGYANDTSTTGQKKTYHYDNQESGRTLWYHDHAVHRTDSNAYMGLAAQYHLHDATDSEFGLPTGEFELPITLRDAAFSSDGTLLFDDRSQSSLMGDVLLVNGIPWPYKDVYKRRYRIRLLNASVSRSYLLTLSDPRAKMYMISGDGGFAPKPVQISSLRIGMAERYGLILDFTDCADNATVVLRNGDLPNNVRFDNTDKVMQFRVIAGKAPDTTNNEIPPLFYTPVKPKPGVPPGGPAEVMGLEESQATKRRTLEFVRKNGLWTINGRTWDEVTASNFQNVIADPVLNSIEVWDLVNNSGGWFHPVHIHLVDFKILSRNGGPPLPAEGAPKDVVYVGEGHRIRLIAKFGPHEGRYMIHCHNLVHEDHDMMHQFRVGPPKNPDPNDPITAAPPEPA